MRLKGQRVSESSSERTHNTRCYATLPGVGSDVVRPDIQARTRAAWRCVRRHHDKRPLHLLAASRSGPSRAEAVGVPVFRRGLCWSESASA